MTEPAAAIFAGLSAAAAMASAGASWTSRVASQRAEFSAVMNGVLERLLSDRIMQSRDAIGVIAHGASWPQRVSTSRQHLFDLLWALESSVAIVGVRPRSPGDIALAEVLRGHVDRIVESINGALVSCPLPSAEIRESVNGANASLASLGEWVSGWSTNRSEPARWRILLEAGNPNARTGGSGTTAPAPNSKTGASPVEECDPCQGLVAVRPFKSGVSYEVRQSAIATGAILVVMVLLAVVISWGIVLAHNDIPADHSWDQVLDDWRNLEANRGSARSQLLTWGAFLPALLALPTMRAPERSKARAAEVGQMQYVRGVVVLANFAIGIGALILVPMPYARPHVATPYPGGDLALCLFVAALSAALCSVTTVTWWDEARNAGYLDSELNALARVQASLSGMPAEVSRRGRLLPYLLAIFVAVAPTMSVVSHLGQWAAWFVFLIFAAMSAAHVWTLTWLYSWSQVVGAYRGDLFWWFRQLIVVIGGLFVWGLTAVIPSMVVNHAGVFFLWFSMGIALSVWTYRSLRVGRRFAPIGAWRSQRLAARLLNVLCERKANWLSRFAKVEESIDSTRVTTQ